MLKRLERPVTCHSLAFSQSSLSGNSSENRNQFRFDLWSHRPDLQCKLSFIMRIIWDFPIHQTPHDRALWGTRGLQSSASSAVMENMCLRCVFFCSARMKLNVWLSFLFFSGLSWSQALCDTISVQRDSRVLVGLFKPSVQGYFGRLRNLKGTVPNSTRNNSQSMLQEVFFRKLVSMWH